MKYICPYITSVEGIFSGIIENENAAEEINHTDYAHEHALLRLEVLLRYRHANIMPRMISRNT